MNNLASVYDDQGKYAQAEALDSQTLEIQRRVLGPEHPDTLSSMNNLAIVYDCAGKVRAGRGALSARPWRSSAACLGPEHPDTLDVHEQSGQRLRRMQGKYAQAEALYSQTLEIRRRILGPEHPSHADFHEQSGHDATTSEGKYAQAEALYSQTLEIERRVLGPEHPDTLTSMSNLADVYYRAGQVRAGRGAVPPDPGDPAAACWVPSILAPSTPSRILHPCTNDRANTAWRRLTPRRPWRARRHALGSEHPDTMAIGGRPGAGLPVAGEVRRERAARARGPGVRSKEAAGRLAAIPRREPAGRQPGWTEEIRRSGTAAARRLSGMVRAERPDRRPGLVSPGPRPRMACPTLSGVGQAGKGCRVEEKVRSSRRSAEFAPPANSRKHR